MREGLSMDTTVAAVVLPSLITGVLTYFATRVSSKANLEQTNIENAKILYEKYEKLNLELETKVDELEAKGMNDIDERGLDSFLGKTGDKVKERKAFY